jgi:serine/threonine protein kinase/tetratricopeptide (TPR) repeat protein
MSGSANPAKSIFLEALEKHPPEHWPAFLEQACAGDAPLRDKVEKLLRARTELGSFHEAPLSNSVETIDAPITERPGTVIGPYKLMEQIGEGGMGLVFVAEQQHPVRRKVALKVIKPGMDTRQVVARFEAERQALALMDHPSIAKVHDGGETGSGRPYFVMELVKGVPITEYCDQNQVAIRERLQLFTEVCQAVQHAHQKGIIHRDIKPSNVLVMSHDGLPVVKVIDFGVAKAVGQQLSEKTVYTQFAQMIGTPLYMSPEQAGESSLDVDTRSDIYSLGVLLYELFTGTTPFDKEELRQANYEEIRRIIREQEPPRPSARISTLGLAASTISTQRKSDPKRLSHLLRGDLDWIVMRALAKNRNERYATAKELADDVERFLDDRPVLARPPTLRDRLRKWARRHKPLVRGAAALAALAMVALAVGTLLLTAKNRELARANGQEREARAQADTNFDLAKESINEFLTRVTEDRELQMRGLQPLRKKLLASAVPFLEKLAQQRPGGAAVESQRAWAYGRLHGVRKEMGELERSLADTEEMWAILERLAHDFPAEASYRRDLAQAHLNRGACLQELHRPVEALAAYGESQRLWDTVVAGAPLIDPALARLHVNRGSALCDLGRHEEAVADYQAAAAIQEKVVAASPEYRRDQAICHCNLANSLRLLRRLKEALAAVSRAAQIQDKLLAEAPDDPLYAGDLGATRLSLANVLADLNRPEEALAAYEKVLASMKPLAARFQTLPRPRLYQAMSYNGIVNLFMSHNLTDEALTYSQKGLAVQEKLVADFPKIPEHRTELATAYMNRGVLLWRRGRREEARTSSEKALALHEALARDYPEAPEHAVTLGGSYCNMGAMFNDLGRPEEALPWLARAIATLEAVQQRASKPATAQRFLVNSLNARAEALDKLQRYPEALADWDRSVALEEGPRRVEIRLARAGTLARAGKHAEAVAEAAALTGEKNAPPRLLYNAACVFAVASAVPSDNALRERYAAQSIELLGTAIDRGFKNARELQKDPDLEPLRQRADFKKMVQRIAPKNKP